MKIKSDLLTLYVLRYILGNILYVSWDNIFMSVHICQNSSRKTLKRDAFYMQIVSLKLIVTS